MFMRPKIVVLDGYTLSPLAIGEHSPIHPSWDELAALGDLTIHSRTAAGEIMARADGADVLLTNKVPIDAGAIRSLKRLKFIGVMATGTNIVDGSAAGESGIPVTNVPGYSTPSVVQIVFSLLFELAARPGETALAVRSGAWSDSPDFCFTLAPFRELAGKTFGIVGFGTIGAAVAGVASALGMRVIVNSRTRKESSTSIEWVSRERLFAESDVISLHCPLTDETRGLINCETLAAMKHGALLINTGRGPLLDEQAVAGALHGGSLGGLGADVLSSEPPPEDHPLIAAPNTVITPHIAWASVESRTRLMAMVAGNLRAFLNGNPTNVVNNPRVSRDR